MVPAVSHRISRVLRYSGYGLYNSSFRIRDYHPLRSNFPVLFFYESSYLMAVLQPQPCRNNVGLGSSAFARHYLRNHYYFLFLRVMRCFSSPRLPTALRYTGCPVGCPIRISADHRIFAPNRSFSQLITSFFASESLGIHLSPLFTFFVLLLRAGGIHTCSSRCSNMSMSFCLSLSVWRITDSNR